MAFFRKRAPRPDADWLRQFPTLRALDDEAGRRVLAAATPVIIPAGTTVYREGDPCQNFFLVLDGAVRVQKVSESGREIVLYRVEAGQSCILTTTNLLSRERYAAEGVAETDVEAIMIPLALFRDGLDHSPGFRDFVFNSYGQRVSELITLIDAVAFGRVDLRLTRLLLNQADASGRFDGTHQQLAAELGTAREVVSRQLKEFERKGWVRLGRGRVEIVDRDALAAVGERD
ncbi:Crp/Fnr family transcriptional regulator [Endothiovibrio diazotrophicus]